MRFQLSVNSRTYRPGFMLVHITWRSLNMHVFSAGFFSQPGSTLYHLMPRGLHKQTRWKSSKGCSARHQSRSTAALHILRGGHLDKHRCSSSWNLSLDKPPPPPPVAPSAHSSADISGVFHSQVRFNKNTLQGFQPESSVLLIEK